MVEKVFYCSLAWAVSSHHNSVVTFIGLQSDLFTGLESLLAEFVHLAGKDSLRGGSGIDTVCFDTDNEVTSALQEMMSVDSHDTCLIRLGHISKDHINHTLIATNCK